MKNCILLLLFLLISLFGFGQGLDGNITPSSPAICSGAAVVLNANGTGGTPGYTYFWITTGENTQSITITTARTYTVRITDQAGSTKDVSITIAANTTPDPPTATNTSGAVCINSSARLEATAPAGATFIWYANSQGGEPLATGAVFNTPPITTASTIYYVSASVNECESRRIGVAVSLAANPTVVGATVCANNSAILTASGAQDYVWWDASSGGNQVGSGPTFPTPVLTQTTTYYVEGITASGCRTERIPVVATVTQAPGAPTVSAQPYIICINSRATLQATGPAGVLFDWFDVAEGGVSLITSPDYTTPVLSANKTYWVQASLNECSGPRTRVEVVVNDIPEVPQATSDGPVCVNASATLRVTNPAANRSYQWFETATSLTSIHTGTVFNTPAITGATTFYVRAVNGPCISGAFPVQVTLLPVIEKPNVSGATLICSASTTDLNIIQPNANYIYEWFATESAVTPIHTGTAFTTPLVDRDTTFYVQARSGNCTSARTAITITLLPLPPQPSYTPVNPICYNTTATLVADNGTAYRWYTSEFGGSPISSDRIFTTDKLTINATFYVANLVDGCESKRTAVSVSVNAQIPAPAVDDPGAAVCRGTSVTLHAHSSSGVLQWFLTDVGGNKIFEGPDYQVTVNNTTTFYVQVANGDCISARTPVTINVLPYVSRQFEYSAGTYCPTSGNQSPTIYVSGGTFNGSAGLVINSVTGEIDIAATGLGRFTVNYTTNNGSCNITTTAAIDIVASADAEFSYNSNIFCQGGTNPRPQFTSGSRGQFTASPGGLSINSVTGEIDLSLSQPGNYTVTNTVTLSCGGSDVETFPVQIRASVVVNAGNDRYAAREPFTLSGTLSRNTTVMWTTTNGQGVITNPTSLNNAVYTPGANDTDVTFILTASDAGACGDQTARVTITFINRPNAPATTTDTVCVGNRATLTAFVSGATSYKWYSVSVGGPSLHTGANYTTDPLMTVGVSSFWVEALVNGVNGPREEVRVLVEEKPSIPTVAGARDICTGDTTLLIATSTNAIRYRWFNADKFPVPGGDTLRVPVFTNTSYFVQAEGHDCVSAMFEVPLTVKPLPQIISDRSIEICSGTTISYSIESDLTGTTFTWSRDALAAINNNQPGSGSGDIISETLTSSSPAVQTVTYVIRPTSPGGCPGEPFNYTVVVNPMPVLTSDREPAVCNNMELGYLATFNPGVNEFSWSRDAVEGISNLSVADQASRNIREALHNTTNVPKTVIYRFTFTTASGCTNTFNLPVVVNPSAVIDSKDFDLACANVPFVYQITSNVDGATYNWLRYETGDNPQASRNDVTSINETLINNSSQQLDVYYFITPMFNGCPGEPFTYHVIVNPQPAQPVLNANIYVCEDNTLTLQTDAVPGATYRWTLVDGSSKDTPDPVLNINNVTLANAGTYSLVVIVNGCSSVAGTREVFVNRKPVADAGPAQTVCPTATEVSLNGSVQGGTTSGIWSGGTGTFSAINDLRAKYFPSDQDKANGSVTLTLTSASPDDCTPAVSQVLITFGFEKVADAGADQTVCSQETNVNLTGTIAAGKGSAAWETSGTGGFDAQNQSTTVYHPSQADFAAGFVILTLRASAPGACDVAEDEMRVTFAPPPTVTADASPVRYVLKGRTITLHPIVSDENVTYQWTANPASVIISDPTVRNLVVTGGEQDVIYTVTVTNALLCTSVSSDVLVKVSPQLIAPNTFTPNADGSNDLWVLQGVEAYQNVVVDIYNRLGQVVYHSVGYPKPWDGTSGGKPVPFGVYYFIIDTKEFDQKLSGYVTIVR